MLKRKRQQKFLNKRWLEMRSQLRTFSDSGSQEALHKLRVEIKKIKAFTKLANLSKGGKDVAERLKAIRKVFHHAGIIREANINLEMIKKFKIRHPAFNAETTRTLQQESGKFRLHTPRYYKHIGNTVKSLLKGLHPVRNSAIKHWFTRQLKKIAIGVTATSTDQLHLARKRIKSLIYVHGILHKRLVARLKLNVDYLDQLQDAIGKWHDTEVAVKLLVPQTGHKVKVNRLQKDQDKKGAAILAISNGFWGKVVQARQ